MKHSHALIDDCVLESTHIENGDDGGVVPPDYGGNILCLGDLRRDQLKVKQKEKRGNVDV